jgi:hypothetical protein
MKTSIKNLFHFPANGDSGLDQDIQSNGTFPATASIVDKEWHEILPAFCSTLLIF